MPECKIPGCSYRSYKKSLLQRKLEEEQGVISFYRLPHDPILQNLWIKAVEGWNPPSNAVVCSAHFKADDFEDDAGYSKRILKPVSVPSIFNISRGKRQTSLSSLVLSSPKKLKAGESNISAPSSTCSLSSNVDVGSKEGSRSSSKIIKFRTTAAKISTNLKKIILPSSSLSKKISSSEPNSSFPLEDSSCQPHCFAATEPPTYNENTSISSSIPELSQDADVSRSDSAASLEELVFPSDSEVTNDTSSVNAAIPGPSKKSMKKSFTSKILSVIRVKTPAPSDNLTADVDSICSKVIEENLSRKEKKRRDKAEKKRLRKEERLRRAQEKRQTANTPRKQKLRKRLLSKNRVIKTLRQVVRRKSKKIGTMANIIKHLDERKLMTSDDLEILKCIGGVNKEFLDRQIAKVTNTRLKRKYEEDLRAFALTLHYKSVAAYNYVRQVFNLALPHPNTIYRWYRCIDGAPGFTSESFKALREKYDSHTGPVFAGLVLDEMSIRRLIETDGTKYFGFVDMGSGVDSDSAEEAKEALVIMLVCINGNWKLPLGYFLTNGTTGEQKANLIHTGLRLLDETKVTVVSLTSDGLGSNKTMFKKLGCELEDLNSLKTWFLNPVNDSKIHVFLDSSHMIKLVRNTLGDKGVIFDSEGNVIKWSYIKSLHELQETEGLKLGNKLSAKHIFFFRNKMKVALATQVLSKSVADALQVLLDLKLEEFEGVEPTIKFLRMFDRLFDVFNSRSVNQLDFKQPLTKENINSVRSYLSECETYIKGLCLDKEGTPLTSSLRKTGFIGFLIDIPSLLNLFDMLCINNSLPYLATHKLCQDHLEIFFGFIRMRGGLNNNPSARQFMSSYKKCLVHLELKGNKSGNCVPIENISILTCSSKSPERVINMTAGCPEIEVDDLDNFEAYLMSTWDETDHSYGFYPGELTILAETILCYIAGFLVKRLIETCKCINCISALIETPTRKNCHLINVKNRGGLIVPSEDVVKIVKICEKVIRLAFSPSNTRTLLPDQTPEKLTNQSMKLLYVQYDRLFICLKDHSRNQDPMFDHKYFLIKSIACRFISLRVHHICKGVINTADSRRRVFNKLLLFYGQ